MSKKVSVTIYNLPGGGGGCCTCGGVSCGPEYEALMRQKLEELGAALEASYPGQTVLSHIDLSRNPAEKDSPIGQLLVTKKYPSPLVAIDGEARFAGSILVGKIVKAVGAALGS